MSGNTAYKKKFVSICLHPMIWVLLILFTAGCGDNAASPAATENTAADTPGTGSASFSVHWQPGNTVSATAEEIPRYAIDCAAVGIETITCNVYDENNNLVTTSESWQCADGGAKMERIPEGSNLTFTIFGWDAEDGNIIYQGRSETPVNIIAGETTDAGTIQAHPFVPTQLGANAVSSSQINLTWSDLGAPGYRIYQDGVRAASATSPSFSVIDLTANTQYCYTVSAVDVYGNVSGRSTPACATTSAEDDTQAPTTPSTPEIGEVSASQIDISWTASDDNVGVAGYRVYRDGQEVGTTPTTTFSDGGLGSETEYCYSVSAYDDAGNQSDQTSTTCATTQPTLAWYLDSDEDGYGDPNAEHIVAVNQPEGYVSDNTDCNDSDASINPGAEEICNEVDDDCDEDVDEGVQKTYYLDNDGDEFGDPGEAVQACAAPEGYVDNDADCRDDLPDVNPDATEICGNDIDDNCSGQTDERCVVFPRSSFTARLTGNDKKLAEDASDREGQQFNSAFLYIGEDTTTSDRVGLEFNTTIVSENDVDTVLLQFEMENTNAPTVSELSMYSYYANGDANSDDYDITESHNHINSFSDDGTTGRQVYSYDITGAYLSIADEEQSYMGILIATDNLDQDESVRYNLYNPVLVIIQDGE
jgi:chitodextrinase